MPKEVLYDRLWPKTFVEAGNLHNLVSEIRRTLGDESHQILRTVHGVGYSFDARDVEVSLGASPFVLWMKMPALVAAFPFVDRVRVRRLSIPILMSSGEKSYAIGKAIDAELERVVLNDERVIIPNGTHDSCTEYPAACAAESRRFLPHE